MSEPIEGASQLSPLRLFRTRQGLTRTSDCLDDDIVAAAAEGRLPDTERGVILTHLAACDRCRAVVASVALAMADPSVAQAARVASVHHAARRPHLRMVAATVAAAAAVILVLALPSRLDEPLPTHRAPPITAGVAPEAVFPVGAVSEARNLHWTSVPGAERYRVTLYDADGGVRYEAELTGTDLVLPDSVAPTGGRSYFWQVDARLGFDRWATSELIEFSVGQDFRR